MEAEALLDRRRSLLGAAAPLFYQRPLHLVRGEGVWLFDAEGRRYLDAYNNVPHVGHCHPHVVDALCRQAATLNTHTRYLDETILDYDERLVANFEPALSMVHLCCSGTEANELALRIARACTGNVGVIVTDFAYHGNSKAIIELSSAYLGPEGLGKTVRTITIPDFYRLGPGVDPATAAEALAEGVAAAIASLADAQMKPAAILFDTVFATEGLPSLSPDCVAGAVEQVRAAGGLYIADEVQPGFGRMGNHMWGYQHYDVVPDLVTMGKPMGNGHPLAGVVGRAELINGFGGRGMYFNTFGGNPVACAVGLAVLEVIEQEGLVEKAHMVGEHLRVGLGALSQQHTMIGDVRGRGLFWGVEMVEDRASKAPATQATRAILNGMREHGVLIGTTGRDDSVLKIRPPMPFSIENADLLLATLDEVIAGL
jgi:4-aminobutyrate aminotransferase-like enzyme